MDLVHFAVTIYFYSWSRTKTAGESICWCVTSHSINISRLLVLIKTTNNSYLCIYEFLFINQLSCKSKTKNQNVEQNQILWPFIIRMWFSDLIQTFNYVNPSDVNRILAQCGWDNCAESGSFGQERTDRVNGAVNNDKVVLLWCVRFILNQLTGFQLTCSLTLDLIPQILSK